MIKSLYISQFLSQSVSQSVRYSFTESHVSCISVHISNDYFHSKNVLGAISISPDLCLSVANRKRDMHTKGTGNKTRDPPFPNWDMTKPNWDTKKGQGRGQNPTDTQGHNIGTRKPNWDTLLGQHPEPQPQWNHCLLNFRFHPPLIAVCKLMQIGTFCPFSSPGPQLCRSSYACVGSSVMRRKKVDMQKFLR